MHRRAVTYLVATSLIWAFSFGLIKGHLTAYDSLAVAASRLAISTLLFLPFLRPRSVGWGRGIICMLLGAVQFGAMYSLYIAAYAYLPAYGVALMTIFTPLYVVLIASGKRFSFYHAGGAVLAVAGAALVMLQDRAFEGAWIGVLLVQGSNVCFAIGQVSFRRLVQESGGSNRAPEVSLVAWMYLGSLLFTSVLVFGFADRSRMAFEPQAVLVLLYLGIVPTALGFYLWNKGAARAGGGMLAVANNLKVPFAVLVSWLIFAEQAPYAKVLAGLVVIIAGLALASQETGRRRALLI